MAAKHKEQPISALLQFLDSSPTAWHAVENCSHKLIKMGFTEIKEEDSWKLKPGQGYFVKRNGSSLCAFVLPQKTPHALHIAAAHTDSPAFKLKPNAEFTKENMRMLGVEIYGGPLLVSWLNRDLAIAGRVVYSDTKGHTRESLVRLDDTPVVIPQLAIHLDREVNEKGLVLNKQEHLAALTGLADKNSKASFLEKALKAVLPMKQLLGSDLFLYPMEPPRLLGEHRELIASYRIDNLVGVYTSLEGLIHAKTPHRDTIKMAVFWDNEEIGSHTAQGAGSPFLAQLIERICLALGLSREDYFRMISRSLCASVDLGHALHPNYADKHEPRHVALMNKGILIKTNAQHRYASDARSSATIVNLCHKHKIPFQKYMSRGDIPCGTTVGPIHATLTGMPTIDIGVTQLSMHSCREVMGVKDFDSLCSLLKAFLSDE